MAQRPDVVGHGRDLERRELGAATKKPLGADCRYCPRLALNPHDVFGRAGTQGTPGIRSDPAEHAKLWFSFRNLDQFAQLRAREWRRDVFERDRVRHDVVEPRHAIGIHRLLRQELLQRPPGEPPADAP